MKKLIIDNIIKTVRQKFFNFNFNFKRMSDNIIKIETLTDLNQEYEKRKSEILNDELYYIFLEKTLSLSKAYKEHMDSIKCNVRDYDNEIKECNIEIEILKNE